LFWHEVNLPVVELFPQRVKVASLGVGVVRAQRPSRIIREVRCRSFRFQRSEGISVPWHYAASFPSATILLSCLGSEIGRSLIGKHL